MQLCNWSYPLVQKSFKFTIILYIYYNIYIILNLIDYFSCTMKTTNCTIAQLHNAQFIGPQDGVTLLNINKLSN